MYPILLTVVAALIVGLAKSGLKGTSVFAVVCLALAHGSKASTGIMLPLLLAGDVLAIWHYKRHVKWEYLIKCLPAVAIGVVFAAWYGKDLDEQSFKFWMSLIILCSVVIIIWREWKKFAFVKDSLIVAIPLGLAIGFTTMIGNLAGGLSALYFLATGLDKNDIIGTAAWLFFIINLFKLPFHIFIWKTISVSSFVDNAYLIPVVILGFIIGIYLVKKISEQNYRYFLIGVTTLSALIIIFE